MYHQTEVIRYLTFENLTVVVNNCWKQCNLQQQMSFPELQLQVLQRHYQHQQHFAQQMHWQLEIDCLAFVAQFRTLFSLMTLLLIFQIQPYYWNLLCCCQIDWRTQQVRSLLIRQQNPALQFYSVPSIYLILNECYNATMPVTLKSSSSVTILSLYSLFSETRRNSSCVMTNFLT